MSRQPDPIVTARRERVLKLFREGFTSTVIALKLNLEPRMVQWDIQFLKKTMPSEELAAAMAKQSIRTQRQRRVNVCYIK